MCVETRKSIKIKNTIKIKIKYYWNGLTTNQSNGDMGESNAY
jgi:hypothetical protein